MKLCDFAAGRDQPLFLDAGRSKGPALRGCGRAGCPLAGGRLN